MTTFFYVYGIVDGVAGNGLASRGHGDASIFPLRHGDLAAAVSVWRGSTISASAENVWHHELVLRGLMERCTVLPMRFGTIADDAGVFSSFLETQYEKLIADLQRIEGKVEMALRILGNVAQTGAILPEEQSGRPVIAPGAAYLQARIRRLYGSEAARRAVQAARPAIRDTLSPLSVDALWAADDDPVLPIKASYLVKRDVMAAFSEAANAVADQCPDIRLTCTGPWAPYSFVGSSMASASDLQ